MLKRLTPRTLLGRAIVIVVTPIVLLQLILAIVFFNNHWDNITRRLSLGIAGDIAVLIRLMHDSEPGQQKQLMQLSRSFMDMQLTLLPGEVLPPSVIRRQPVLNIPDRMLHQALGEKLFRPYAVDTANFGDQVQILVQLPDGVLRVITSRKRIDSTSAVIFVLWMIGTSLILLTIAITFLRKQLKPIRKLAKIADALGKGQDVGDIKPTGAIEIRRATRAFMLMQARLRRNVEKRTEMLAGVSHDLRTPLTRMKLELAILGEKIDVLNLESDVRDMETMINGYLAFARDQSAEKPVETNLEEVLRQIVRDTERRGHKINLRISENLTIPLRRNAFIRCTLNLIDNAITYANYTQKTSEPNIEISAYKNEGSFEIAIDDDGPGIPVHQYVDAFKAFSRLDSARSSETIGVGLGLTIARDIARNHGGDLYLSQSPLGGLRALIQLPI